MRYLIIAALLFAAGCADVSSDIRSPVTAAEKAEAAQFQPMFDRTWLTLWTANKTLCRDRCAPQIYFGPASGIGAHSGIGLKDGKDYIEISTPMLRMLKDDDELAYLIGHEWAHLILSHYKQGEGRNDTKEMQADCVGSLFAARAGYRADAGAAPLLRMRLQTASGWLGMLPDMGPRADRVKRAAAAAKGKTIDRAAIRQVCGAAL